MKALNNHTASIMVFAGGNTTARVKDTDIPQKSIICAPSIIVKSRGNIGFAYYDKPFTHKNEMWSYSAKTDKIILKYVYYYLVENTSYFQKMAKSGKLPQISIPITDNFRIPIPPLNVQKNIVDILDKFEVLTNDLITGIPAEIECRQKQYEYYRSKLMTFN